MKKKLIKDAQITLQFWFDKAGNSNLSTICNKNKKEWCPSSAIRFGEWTAHQDLFNKNDHRLMTIFCQAYLAERLKMYNRKCDLKYGDEE